MIRKLLQTLSLGTIIAAFYLVSTYIYLHVTEELFFIDLPHIDSVSATNLPQVVWQVKEGSNVLTSDQKYGFFGIPQTLRIPRLDFTVGLQESPNTNAGWQVGRGLAGTHFLSPSQSGRMGNLIVFALPQSRALDAVELAVEGERIIIDTKDKWRYNFRVSKKTLATVDEPFLSSASSSSKVIILRQVPGEKYVLVLESELLNVEDKNI